MHDVAWRGMWICVRSKDAQKQLARTSLRWFPGFALRIPTAHDYASSARAHERARVQNIRDFPQTKLISEIKSSFSLKRARWPPLFIL